MNDTWVYANGPIRRTTTVVTFYPRNDFPKSCIKCENPNQASCRLYAPHTEYNTSTGGISFPLQSNYDASAIKCQNP